MCVKRSELTSLSPGKSPDTGFAGGWVGPVAGLDGRAEENSLVPPGFKPRTFQSVANLCALKDCHGPSNIQYSKRV